MRPSPTRCVSWRGWGGAGWACTGAPSSFPDGRGPPLPGVATARCISPQLKQPEWAPDFGPSSFVPRWGATATGARKFLIAFNVNLLGTREQAHRIALNIREQGRGRDQVRGSPAWASTGVHGRPQLRQVEPLLGSRRIPYS